MYVETIFQKYHSNVSGDSVEFSHPIKIKLPNGEIFDVSEDVRTQATDKQIQQHFNKTGDYTYKKMIVLNDQIKFKVISSFELDCQRSGNTIRWNIPKNSELIYEENS